MPGKVFGAVCLTALVFCAFSGEWSAVGGAVLEGADTAVRVSLSLLGTLCLWGGMLEVLKEAGVTRLMARLLRPILRRAFPRAWSLGEGDAEISANVSANLLGLGNAATPMGLEAMKRLQRHNPDPHRASGEQCALMVLNTCAVTLLPTTLLALRRAAGSSTPQAVLIPVWIVSSVCFAVALLLSRLLSACDRGR